MWLCCRKHRYIFFKCHVCMVLFHTVPQLVAGREPSLLSVQVSTLVVELSCNTFWIVEEKRLSTEHIRTWYNGQHNVMAECSANKQMVTEKQHSSSMSEFIQHTLPTVIHIDKLFFCLSMALWGVGGQCSRSPPDQEIQRWRGVSQACRPATTVGLERDQSTPGTQHRLYR